MLDNSFFSFERNFDCLRMDLHSVTSSPIGTNLIAVSSLNVKLLSKQIVQLIDVDHGSRNPMPCCFTNRTFGRHHLLTFHLKIKKKQLECQKMSDFTQVYSRFFFYSFIYFIYSTCFQTSEYIIYS